MYSMKVNYFIDDIVLLKNRVDRQMLFHHRESVQNLWLEQPNQPLPLAIPQAKTSRLLVDDPMFNIFLDLVPYFDLGDDGPDSKRRKLSTEETQEAQYSTTYQPTFTTGLEDYNRAVDDFIDQDFEYSVNDDHTGDSLANFQLDSNGQLIADNILFANDIDLGFSHLENPNENGITDVIEQQHSISRDGDFFISTGEFTHHQPQLNGDKPKKKTRQRLFTVQQDKPDTTFSRKELSSHLETYEESMLSRLVTKPGSLTRAGVIAEFKKVPPFVNYCQRAIFGNRINDNGYISRINQDVSRITREIELIRKVQRKESQGLEHEIGRDLALYEQNTTQNEQEYSVLLDHDDNVDLQDDILDITFGNIDTSGQHSSSQLPNQAVEPEENYNDSSTIVNRQLSMYLSFLTIKSKSLGRTTDEQYHLSTPSGEPAGNGVGVVSISDVMPNLQNTTEDAISKTLAAKSLSTLLTLASRNLIAIKATTTDSWQLHSTKDIDVIIPN